MARITVDTFGPVESKVYADQAENPLKSSRMPGASGGPPSVRTLDVSPQQSHLNDLLEWEGPTVWASISMPPGGLEGDLFGHRGLSSSLTGLDQLESKVGAEPKLVAAAGVLSTLEKIGLDIRGHCEGTARG